MKSPRLIRVLLLLAILSLSLPTTRSQDRAPEPEWPEITKTTKPWTRWWWMGNAVTDRDLSAVMARYAQAGLGGLEITPIYGVKGTEDQFIEYLSPRWMERFTLVLREGERLDLGIDMATGTGWPFGGPWVGPRDACKDVDYQTYHLSGGGQLSEPVRSVQEPMARAIGRRIGIQDLVEPIADNKNLQALALEQVRFPKPLPLQVLMAYSKTGQTLDLTDRVDADGRLQWTAPAGDWTLYALFQGWHGKMVERAAPGGEGNVLDYFSADALRDYLERFDEAFAGHDTHTLRAFFNDSYEVDDARGQADWTPTLFEEFRKRRGYALRDHLPALFGQASAEENTRVLTDYRQTISDLLLDNFTASWRDWAHENQAIVRNQAHGSPGNLLDLYAASDIPETEGTEILRFKFASSAAHVTGKQLISSESATWLKEHFTATLGDVKTLLDKVLLGGVNHIFYHGTPYSPPEADWPGWMFYASVNFSPTNTFWDDFSALNAYVARCQSFLQSGQPDNDVLLYFPIFDYYAERGRELLTHFDSREALRGNSAFAAGAQLMQKRGYTVDFISDRQIQGIKATGGRLRTPGGTYQTIVIPESNLIPLATFRKVVDLARDGATVICFRGLPADVPGLGDLERRQYDFQQLLGQLRFADSETGHLGTATVGRGRILLGNDLYSLLSTANIRRETLTDQKLQFVRRRAADGHYYFIVNTDSTGFDGWVPLQVKAASAALFDPMQHSGGYARIRSGHSGATEVYLQIPPGDSRIIQTFDSRKTGRAFPYYEAAGAPVPLTGKWSVTFTQGGPTLPDPVTITTLDTWTGFGGQAVRDFSGTARYRLTFSRPANGGDGWLLDLGDVRESARVTLNGQPLGTLIGPEYQISVEKELLQDSNTLEIDVSNLMANHIAYLDRNDVPWKKFYNVNFPARRRENTNRQGLFDASDWPPRDAGLLGPVTLTPLRRRSF